MIKKIIEYVFGICFHDYNEHTKMPMMESNPEGHCQYVVQRKCGKCGKTHEIWSDVHLGMKVMEYEGVPNYRNTIYEQSRR